MFGRYMLHEYSKTKYKKSENIIIEILLLLSLVSSRPRAILGRVYMCIYALKCDFLLKG